MIKLFGKTFDKSESSIKIVLFGKDFFIKGRRFGKIPGQMDMFAMPEPDLFAPTPGQTKQFAENDLRKFDPVTSRWIDADKEETESVTRIFTIPKETVEQIKQSVRSGYDHIQEGMISPKKKGIMLIDKNSKVRGTFDLDMKETIQKIIDEELKLKEVIPHADWQDNLIKTRIYAKDLMTDKELETATELGMDWTSKESIQKYIDAKLKGINPKFAGQEFKVPTFGIANNPDFKMPEKQLLEITKKEFTENALKSELANIDKIIKEYPDAKVRPANYIIYKQEYGAAEKARQLVENAIKQVQTMGEVSLGTRASLKSRGINLDIIIEHNYDYYKKHLSRQAEQNRETISETRHSEEAVTLESGAPESAEEVPEDAIPPELNTDNVSLADKQETLNSIESQIDSDGELIKDFGQKIGGARKDTADRGFTYGKKKGEKEPVWMKGFDLGEEDGVFKPFKHDNGRILWESKKAYNTKEGAILAIKVLNVVQKYRIREKSKGNFEIYRRVTDRKFPTMKEGFATMDEAYKELASNVDYYLNYKPLFPERPHIERLERTGKEHRTGNITPKKFQETFGFAGGEFGNWIPQDERQNILNMAYDGLLDLAEILNIPPVAISLGGKLSVGFGSRGHGLTGASAHYEPHRAVFNLTRMKGAGSVAHEWFHALDHYLGMQDRKKEFTKDDNGLIKTSDTDFLSEGSAYISGLKDKELKDTFRNIYKTLMNQEKIVEVSVDRYSRQLARYNDDIKNGRLLLKNTLTQGKWWGAKKNGGTPEQLAKLEVLFAKLDKGEYGEKVKIPTKVKFAEIETTQTFKELNDLHKEILGSGGYKNDSGAIRDLDRLYWKRNNAKNELEKYTADNKEIQSTPTRYYYDAKDIDKLRASDHWSKPCEMMARAFEAYVHDKVSAGGNKSDYLVHSTEKIDWYLLMFGLNPYPKGVERETINKAFDKFIGLERTIFRNSDMEKSIKMVPITGFTTETDRLREQEKLRKSLLCQ